MGQERQKQIMQVFCTERPGSCCIGVGDLKEYKIEKPKYCTLEKRSWSEKKSTVTKC
jgi:hypothetical protein